MKKIFSLLTFLAFIIMPCLQASEIKLEDELQMRCSSSSSSSSESCSSSSHHHRDNTVKCKIALADLIGFNQGVGVNRNILYTKINLVDPRHFYDATTASSLGQLVIRHSGTFDIVFFAFASGEVELLVNGQFLASTDGSGSSISVPDVFLEKGDILTLHNASSVGIEVRGAGLTVSLIESEKS